MPSMALRDLERAVQKSFILEIPAGRLDFFRSNSHRQGSQLDRRIIGFHQDEFGDWVADLKCGHTQHVRHNPPWINRPWVLTPKSRAEKLGATLNCKRCDEATTS
jgi:hypothetical protein